jgi:hypothetical protein
LGDAKAIGRLLCVSHVFANALPTADNGERVTAVEFLGARKRYELAFAELRLEEPRRAEQGRLDTPIALEQQGRAKRPDALINADRRARLEREWALLEHALGSLFVMCEAGWPTMQRPPGKTLWSAEGFVYDQCTLPYQGHSRTPPPDDPDPRGNRTAIVGPARLYASIGAACTRYLTDVVNPQLADLLGAALLKELGRRWAHYRVLAQSVGSMFNRIDQYHTKRGKLPAVNPRTARPGATRSQKAPHPGGKLALAEVAFRDTVLLALGDQLEELRTATRQRNGPGGCSWSSLDDLFDVFDVA